MNAWNCLILAAIITPKAVRVNDSSSNSPMRVTISTGWYGKSAKPARIRNHDALESRDRGTAQALANHDRGPATGATRISRRNPNSLSHTIDAADNIAVNSTDIARTPG